MHTRDEDCNHRRPIRKEGGEKLGVRQPRRVKVGGGHARSPSEERIDGAEVECASAGIGQSSDAGTEELRPPRHARSMVLRGMAPSSIAMVRMRRGGGGSGRTATASPKPWTPPLESQSWSRNR